MATLFSQQSRIATFRKLWVALARAQQELGLEISTHQIQQMEAHVDKIDFHRAAEYEKRFHHDVMAHIYAFGEQCPDAKPIIHLGATSCYVTDNADLILMRQGLQLIANSLRFLLKEGAEIAKRWADLPCLGYTHFQSAQPTTIGKRICLWLQDFLWDVQEWERLIAEIPLLGAKGATGTQASFLALFHGDMSKVSRLEELIAQEFGFIKIVPISGQTYSRKLDVTVLNALASFAASAHKMGTDLRLLAHTKEILEPFDAEQIGSSAMPFKKNPILSERICGLARFVISLAQNPVYTAATQWLERSLDDSSNRRLAVPEAFLGVDAILQLLKSLLPRLMVNTEEIESRLHAETPLLVMENILMAAVQRGGNRQSLHEELRRIAIAAQKHASPLEFLISQIERERAFGLTRTDIVPLLDMHALVGCAPNQVREFLETI